jgi:hypothetical protein
MVYDLGVWTFFSLCSLTAGEVVPISQMNNGFHVQPWPGSAPCPPQQPQMNNEFKFGPSQFTGFRTSSAIPCDANAQYFNSCFNKPRDQEIITGTSSIAPGIAQKREREQEATSDNKQRRLRDAILLERKHAEALQTSLELHRMMVESYKSTCGAMDDEAQAMFKECLLELVDRWRRVVRDVYVFE